MSWPESSVPLLSSSSYTIIHADATGASFPPRHRLPLSPNHIRPRLCVMPPRRRTRTAHSIGPPRHPPTRANRPICGAPQAQQPPHCRTRHPAFLSEHPGLAHLPRQLAEPAKKKKTRRTRDTLFRRSALTSVAVGLARVRRHGEENVMWNVSPSYQSWNQRRMGKASHANFLPRHVGMLGADWLSRPSNLID